MKWVLAAAFSLLLFIQGHALAQDSAAGLSTSDPKIAADAGGAAPETLYVDALDGYEPTNLSGKKVLFKLLENLPAPSCQNPDCSSTPPRNPAGQSDLQHGGAGK